jgi:hypothetical protein
MKIIDLLEPYSINHSGRCDHISEYFRKRCEGRAYYLRMIVDMLYGEVLECYMSRIRLYAPS